MALGLAVLREGLEPKLVVDSEGVFYRPRGDAIIPWRDIRAVELERWNAGNGRRIFLIRHSGVPVEIKGLGTPAYRAIAQALERHGRKA